VGRANGLESGESTLTMRGRCFAGARVKAPEFCRRARDVE
jgi:hypothetical protein